MAMSIVMLFLDSELSKEFANSVMIKKLCRLLAVGNTYEDLFGNLDYDTVKHFLHDDIRYKCHFSSINKTTPKPTQI